MIPEPGFYERINLEAAAVALCHWDGVDYGEPYDVWPSSIQDSDGSVWLPMEQAQEDYRDRAKAIIEAALVGVQPATVEDRPELVHTERGVSPEGEGWRHAAFTEATDIWIRPNKKRFVSEWKPVGESE